MNSSQKANELLLALSRYLHQPIIQLGDDSQAAVTIGRYKFVFSFSESQHYLLSRVAITVLPHGAKRKTLLTQLLANNYSSAGTMGGILGLEKASGLVWLTYRFPLESEKPESFLKTMAIQTGLAEYWLKTITGYSAPTTA
ncbi:MAG: type III secretion system chaperone [Deltaproteobacteria bacterium]|jgi:hypothetical protein|nr:type III secretion system chaperone [Deltaproteobacteria bacterium]